MITAETRGTTTEESESRYFVHRESIYPISSKPLEVEDTARKTPNLCDVCYVYFQNHNKSPLATSTDNMIKLELLDGMLDGVMFKLRPQTYIFCARCRTSYSR